MRSSNLFNRSRKMVSALAASLLISLNLQANPLEGVPGGDYPLDLAHASVVWKVSHFGFSNYVGRFTDFSANLKLDPKDFTKSSVSVNIKTDSIATSFPYPEEEDFDKLLSEDWFKSGENPEITFKSESVSELVDNKATVKGQLSFLGQTHPVTLDVTLNKATANHPFKKVPAIGFSATTELDRTTWGMTKYAPAIGAKVRVEIEGEFLQTK